MRWSYQDFYNDYLKKYGEDKAFLIEIIKNNDLVNFIKYDELVNVDTRTFINYHTKWLWQKEFINIFKENNCVNILSLIREEFK